MFPIVFWEILTFYGLKNWEFAFFSTPLTLSPLLPHNSFSSKIHHYHYGLVLYSLSTKWKVTTCCKYLHLEALQVLWSVSSLE